MKGRFDAVALGRVPSFLAQSQDKQDERDGR